MKYSLVGFAVLTVLVCLIGYYYESSGRHRKIGMAERLAAIPTGTAKTMGWSTYQGRGYTLQYPNNWFVEDTMGPDWVLFSDILSGMPVTPVVSVDIWKPSEYASAIRANQFDATNTYVVETADKIYVMQSDPYIESMRRLLPSVSHAEATKEARLTFAHMAKTFKLD